MPPDLSSLCVHASVHTRVQLQVSWTNAILLPPGLYPAIHTVQIGGRGPLNFTTREARSPIAPPPHPFHRSWWQINILEQQGRDGQVMCRLKHHNYYFQIQCNCTEWTESGVIFFWGQTKTYHIEQIYKDKKWWDQQLPKLNTFYFNALLPELVHPPLNGKGKIREPSSNWYCWSFP